jgi:hypothetical protein
MLSISSPNNLVFPNTTVGTTSPPQSVTISNVGGSSVSLYIDNSDLYGFTYTTTCGNTLAAGASCTITLVFQPESAGYYGVDVEYPAAADVLVVDANLNDQPNQSDVSVGVSGVALTQAGSPSVAKHTSIWSSEDVATGLHVFGIVSSRGHYEFFRSDGAVMLPQAVWMQDEVSMSDNSSEALADSLNADIQSVYKPTKQLHATLLDAGAPLPQLQYSRTTLTFSPVAPAWVTSVGDAAGYYVNMTDGSVIEISQRGTFTGANESRTCSVNGQLSLPDESFPVFDVSVSIDACGGQATGLAADTLSGVAAIQRSDSETRLYLIFRRPGQLLPIIDSTYLKR